MLEKYPELISITQLCEILGIGRVKAYQLLKANIIKCKRIGKKYIIPKKSVIEFLDM
ncbi:MAG: helix-turn-helix domain-containing protein [Ruminiclostridium sp.]|nr:helix-turn-helix domain-containing protein [Ruminiclostridium sp.]